MRKNSRFVRKLVTEERKQFDMMGDGSIKRGNGQQKQSFNVPACENNFRNSQFLQYCILLMYSYRFCQGISNSLCQLRYRWIAEKNNHCMVARYLFGKKVYDECYEKVFYDLIYWSLLYLQKCKLTSNQFLNQIESIYHECKYVPAKYVNKFV